MPESRRFITLSVHRTRRAARRWAEETQEDILRVAYSNERLKKEAWPRKAPSVTAVGGKDHVPLPEWVKGARYVRLGRLRWGVVATEWRTGSARG